MSDPEIQHILDFWFSDSELNAPTIDSRMERWFGTHSELDQQIEREFGELVQRASRGELMHWKDEPAGRLALIILLDQFRRNVYRGTAEAFSRDTLALKLCIEGTMTHAYQRLSAFQQLFFFMPLQHAESLKVQEKSVRIYKALAETVSETLRETFQTSAHFAELHRDIVAEFGRFPHRNKVLGRANTPAEDEYLRLNAAQFGQ